MRKQTDKPLTRKKRREDITNTRNKRSNMTCDYVKNFWSLKIFFPDIFLHCPVNISSLLSATLNWPSLLHFFLPLKKSGFYKLWLHFFSLSSHFLSWILFSRFEVLFCIESCFLFCLCTPPKTIYFCKYGYNHVSPFSASFSVSKDFVTNLVGKNFNPLWFK